MTRVLPVARSAPGDAVAGSDPRLVGRQLRRLRTERGLALTHVADEVSHVVSSGEGIDVLMLAHKLHAPMTPVLAVYDPGGSTSEPIAGPPSARARSYRNAADETTRALDTTPDRP